MENKIKSLLWWKAFAATKRTVADLESEVEYKGEYMELSRFKGYLELSLRLQRMSEEGHSLDNCRPELWRIYGIPTTMKEAEEVFYRISEDEWEEWSYTAWQYMQYMHDLLGLDTDYQKGFYIGESYIIPVKDGESDLIFSGFTFPERVRLAQSILWNKTVLYKML